MEKLELLIIHCADTPSTMKVTAEDIKRWHMDPPPDGRGWDRPGYSDFIRRDGSLENLNEYDEDKWVQANEVTWGAKGYNGKSRHICLAGGQDENGIRFSKDSDFEKVITPEQFVTLREYVFSFVKDHPDAKIGGHYMFNSKKDCPGYDIRKFLEFIEMFEKNIY